MTLFAKGVQFPVELQEVPHAAEVRKVFSRPKKVVAYLTAQKGMLAEMGFTPMATQQEDKVQA